MTPNGVDSSFFLSMPGMEVVNMKRSRCLRCRLTVPCAVQAALVSCAVKPVTLLVISIAEFSKHATPEVLRVMRDEVSSAPNMLCAAAIHICICICICICIYIYMYMYKLLIICICTYINYII